jgi:hypothetical protein
MAFKRTASFIAACTLLGAAAAFAPASAQALGLLRGSHDGQPGDGFDIGDSASIVVAPGATFRGNGFNGLFDGAASLLVLGGSFDDNANVGLQVITDSTRSVIVAGGSFTGNLGGLDTYGARVTVLRGDFSGNSAYGFSTHSDGRVNGGNFGGNGDYGIFAFGGVTAIYGGSFGSNGWGDLAASGGGVLQLYGVFDHYGALAGNGSFSGTLANGGGLQTLRYAVFEGGSIVLNPVATLAAAAVPEPATPLLFAAGLLVLLRRRARCFG